MLRICLLFFLVCYAGAYALLFFYAPLPLYAMYAAAGICLAGAAALFYVLVRLVLFRRRLVSFLRLVLSGNYKAAIPGPGRPADELAYMEKMVNKFARQLQDIDRLRASRVALISRVISYINRSIPQAIIMADIERKTFSFNPAAQAMFEFEQEALSFDSIRGLKSNNEFMELFNRAVTRERVPQAGYAKIEVPIRNVKKEVFVNIMPFKDNEEKVNLAVILADADLPVDKPDPR